MQSMLHTNSISSRSLQDLVSAYISLVGYEVLHGQGWHPTLSKVSNIINCTSHTIHTAWFWHNKQLVPHLGISFVLYENWYQDQIKLWCRKLTVYKIRVYFFCLPTWSGILLTSITFADDTRLRNSALPCDFQLLTCRHEYCIKPIKPCIPYLGCSVILLRTSVFEKCYAISLFKLV